MSASSSDWKYVGDDPSGTRLGLSLSGGGIRSAAFSLGAYQKLAEDGVFDRLKHLSAVSGGSYLAAALAVSYGRSQEDAVRRLPRPWWRNSAEERHLRTHLTYLAPGLLGQAWLAANLLYGLLLNLTPILLASTLTGKLLGSLYRWLYPGIGLQRMPQLQRLWIPVSIVCVLVAVAITGVAVQRFIDKPRFSPNLKSKDRATGPASKSFVLAGCSLFMIGLLPVHVHLAGKLMVRFAGADTVGGRFVLRWLVAGTMMVALLLAGAIGIALTRRGWVSRLRGVIVFVSSAGIVVLPLLFAAANAAVNGWTWPSDGVAIGASLLCILVFAVFVHNRRYSMHLYYRERLSRAFVLSRHIAHDKVVAEPVPYEEEVLLSAVGREIDGRRERGIVFPELTVCAAVAARSADVPNKTWAASFTFGAVTSGSSELELMIPTDRLEDSRLNGGGELTLPSIVAISGAAVSPFMGRFTMPAYRFLLAMLNVRLGVWIPNPFVSASDRVTSSASGKRLGGRILNYLRRGWLEPGALYVMREALGLANTAGRFIYVSDGGHYENLGLVELIRRKCTHILVLDASSSPAGAMSDIARAVAIARSQLGAEVELDVRPTDSVDGVASTPVAVGSVHYPDGTTGEIFYGRCVVWPEAPADLVAFATADSRFPHHSTANQLFSGEQFDAYRALGWSVAGQLLSKAHLPPKEYDEGVVGQTPGKRAVVF